MKTNLYNLLTKKDTNVFIPNYGITVMRFHWLEHFSSCTSVIPELCLNTTHCCKQLLYISHWKTGVEGGYPRQTRRWRQGPQVQVGSDRNLEIVSGHMWTT